jgi:hypothetical protein
MHQPWFRRALTLHRAMLLVLSMGYKADPLSRVPARMYPRLAMHQPWFRRALTLHRAMLLVLSMGYKADPLPAQAWVMTVTNCLYLDHVLSEQLSQKIQIKKTYLSLNGASGLAALALPTILPSLSQNQNRSHAQLKKIKHGVSTSAMTSIICCMTNQVMRGLGN